MLDKTLVVFSDSGICSSLATIVRVSQSYQCFSQVLHAYIAKAIGKSTEKKSNVHSITGIKFSSPKINGNFAAGFSIVRFLIYLTEQITGFYIRPISDSMQEDTLCKSSFHLPF